MKDRQPKERADCEAKFVVRMTRGDRDAIQVAAKANKRSMNAEIMARIQAPADYQTEVVVRRVVEALKSIS